MIKLSPNTKFSYHIANGTLASRAKLSEELNKQIFQRMLQLYEKKKACSIGVIKNSFNGVLPERKNIQVLSLPLKDYDEYGGGVRIEEGRKNFLSGYSIEVPTNKKKKLNILELSQFMHESTHILDYLLNPKYIANYRQLREKNIYDKKYFSLYKKYFYNTEEMLKNDKKEMLNLAEEETKKGLRKVPFEEKLIFLNYMKYSMQMEHHAYNQDIKFAKLLQKLGKPIDEESLFDNNKFMCFPEKIEIINRLIKEEIEKIRK